MSRWVEQFESHAFQAIWSNLKTSLDESSVDDETVFTSVEELARLRKVISYLDEMMHSLDLELVPMTTWDTFNTQATPCLQQINQYNANKNIAHLTNANANADNLLTYIRPYMLVEGKTGKILQASVHAYAKTIDKYGESFKTRSTKIVNDILALKASSDELHSSIESSVNTINEFNVKLFGDEGSIETRIGVLAADIEEKYENISSFYNETLVGNEVDLSTKKTILEAKKLILGEQEKIEKLLEKVNEEAIALDKFHTQVFGEIGEDEKRAGGLSNDLKSLIQSLKDFEGEQKTKYDALNKEIEALLPGATSVGLATAYKEMKDSFDSPIKNASRVFYWSVGLLVLVSLLLAIDKVGGENWITFVQFTEWSVVLKGLVYKIPFYAPVLWLAFYATKRRSEYHRLQQEYAHKEALAKSYNSYKKQIEDLDVKDLSMQKEFILKTIDAIAYNVSETLDCKHGDKMPAQDLIEKLVVELAKFQGASK